MRVGAVISWFHELSSATPESLMGCLHLLSGYNDSAQSKNEECVSGSFYLQDGPKEMARKACPFKRASLSFCSGLSDTNYGYHEGKPCVILKMNRVTRPPRSSSTTWASVG